MHVRKPLMQHRKRTQSVSVAGVGMATASNPSANLVHDMNLDILENLGELLNLKVKHTPNANEETKDTGGVHFAQEIK